MTDVIKYLQKEIGDVLLPNRIDLVKSQMETQIMKSEIQQWEVESSTLFAQSIAFTKKSESVKSNMDKQLNSQIGRMAEVKDTEMLSVTKLEKLVEAHDNALGDLAEENSSLIPLKGEIEHLTSENALLQEGLVRMERKLKLLEEQLRSNKLLVERTKESNHKLINMNKDVENFLSTNTQVSTSH